MCASALFKCSIINKSGERWTTYMCKTVFLVHGLNTCKISVNYDYWYMYNVQTMVLVYRVLIRGRGVMGGGAPRLASA